MGLKILCTGSNRTILVFCVVTGKLKITNEAKKKEEGNKDVRS